MYNSPYDTAICKNFLVKDKVVPQLLEKIIGGDLYKEDDIYYVTQDNPDVLPFAHPIIIKSPTRDEKIVVVDARGASSIHQASGLLRKTSELTYQTTRAKLMRSIWMDGNSTDILNLGDLQVAAFARMLSDTLTRRLNLDPYVQLNITIISAFYYINLFFDGIGSDENDLLKHAKRISRSINVPIIDVLELIKELGDIKDINSYIRALVFHGNSIRLEKLGAGDLYTMMGGMWWGSNNIENSAVALEHPPTFVAMLYMAISDRSYRKTILSQLADRVGDRKGESAKILIKNVNNVLRG